MTSNSATTNISLGDVAAVLRRQILLIVVLTAILLAATAAVLGPRSDNYESAATILIQPLTLDVLGGLTSSDQLVDLETERQLVTSTAVLQNVIDRGLADDVTTLRAALSVETTDATQVLRVVATDPDAERAAQLADAVAEAYLQQRSSRASRAIDRALERAQERAAGLQQELAELGEVIRELSDRVDDLAAEDSSDAALEAELADAQGRRAILQTQLASTTAGASEIAGLRLEPGTVVSPAVPSAEPVGPTRSLLFAIALIVAPLFGMAGAFARERVDGRVHDQATVEALLGAPVLANVDVRSRDRAGQHSEEAFRRLAIAVAGLSREGDRGLAVALTSVQSFGGRDQLTLDTAMALSRQGLPALIVDVAGGAAGLHRAAGIGQDAFGLVDIAVGGGPTGDLDPLVVLPGSTGLLLPFGRKATGSARPTSAMMQVAMGRFTEESPLALIHTASIREGTDTLDFQRWSDGTILYVPLQLTRTVELIQTKRDLEVVGANLVGVVLVSGAHKRSDELADSGPTHDPSYSGFISTAPTGTG